MTGDVRYDPSLAAVCATIKGAVTRESMAGIIDSAADLARRHSGAGILVDFRRSTGLEFSTEDVQDITRIFESTRDVWQGRRFATVIAREREIGLARMWMSIIDDVVDIETRIFTDIVAAQAWVSGAG